MVNMVQIFVEGIAALGLTAIVYWVLHVTLDTFVATLFGQATLTGFPLLGWNFASAIISAFPIFILIGVNIWIINNAKQRSFED